MIKEICYANGSEYKKFYHDEYDIFRSTEDSNEGYESVYNMIEIGVESTGESIFGERSYFDFFNVSSIRKYPDGLIELKTYKPSTDLYNLYEIEDSAGSVDLTGYDLCPDIKLWLGRATYNTNNKYELYFYVHDENNLNQIANYYNLTYPLPVDADMDVNPRAWKTPCVKFNGEVNFTKNVDEKQEIYDNMKMGSIKFDEDGTPTLLKMYKSNYRDLSAYEKVINVLD